MRNFALIAVLALFPVLASAEEWEHSYPVSGKPEIVVDANDADVEVAMGSSQQVGIRIIANGFKINELQINGTQSGNRVVLKLHRPNRVCFGFCSQSVRVVVRAPRESDLNLRSGDGNLRIDQVRGDFQLDTTDGDIRVRDAEGTLHANTHDGNIEVHGRFDLLNLHTGDGNVDAEVSASQTPQPGWVIRTGDGNVHLRLPNDLGADIDAHSGDGNVKVDFPITTSGTTRENAVRGKINGGGIAIELHTGDGDIRVEKL